jgi:transcriptional regulator of acetoin/glycerol metabolism
VLQDDSTLGDDAENGASRLDQSLDLVWYSSNGEARRIQLDGTLTFGRDASCDVHIPTSATSRLHARLEPDGQGHVIRDLGSRNGVFVDGQRSQSAVLTSGMVIRVGGGVGVIAARPTGTADDFCELAPGLLGGAMLAAVARQAMLAARSRLNIVLEAESGSGKECFARAIHEWSGRSGAFVPINCSALPANLAEAELFGYQRGAFTGADRNYAGYFRASSEGTLFMDEVLDLAVGVQAKVLRAVETRAIVPLGATKELPVATRIVSACQVPMAQAARQGQLRADLFARLNGITIRIPPLRERREDIIPLFQYFVRRAQHVSKGYLTPAAAEMLCKHDWPLNVRELEALALRIGVFYPEADLIGASQIAGLMGSFASEVATVDKGSHQDDPAWDELVGALMAKQGNVVRAAEAVGISRQRAYRLMAQHPELDVARLRRAERCKH